MSGSAIQRESTAEVAAVQPNPPKEGETVATQIPAPFQVLGVNGRVLLEVVEEKGEAVFRLFGAHGKPLAELSAGGPEDQSGLRIYTHGAENPVAQITEHGHGGMVVVKSRMDANAKASGPRVSLYSDDDTAALTVMLDDDQQTELAMERLRRDGRAVTAT
jgi:hypothetical protein